MTQDMLDYIDKEFGTSYVVDYCYAIVNSLIRQSTLYGLNDIELSNVSFNSSFNHVHDMCAWLSKAAAMVFNKSSLQEFGIVHDLNRVQEFTLDGFNIDEQRLRVSSHECLSMIKSTLTRLYIALHGCGIHQAHYKRLLEPYVNEVMVYLYNYIKD